MNKRDRHQFNELFELLESADVDRLFTLAHSKTLIWFLEATNSKKNVQKALVELDDRNHLNEHYFEEADKDNRYFLT